MLQHDLAPVNQNPDNQHSKTIQSQKAHKDAGIKKS